MCTISNYIHVIDIDKGCIRCRCSEMGIKDIHTNNNKNSYVKSCKKNGIIVKFDS